jgi:uncharacterized membrane protein
MTQKSTFIVSSTIILGMLGLSLWTWLTIPHQPIPVHFGIDGQPDAYGSKFEGLMVLPLVTSAANLLFIFLPRIEPRAENLLRSSKAYSAIWISTITFLAVVHGGAIAVVLGQAPRLPAMMIELSVGLLLMVMGNYMAKIRSNFFFGIRTPWTFSSEKSWYKSHRLGGWLLFGLGLGCITVAIAGNPALFWWLLLGGLGGITLILMVYSYLIWKNDPDKRRLGHD